MVFFQQETGESGELFRQHHIDVLPVFCCGRLPRIRQNIQVDKDGRLLQIDFLHLQLLPNLLPIVNNLAVEPVYLGFFPFNQIVVFLFVAFQQAHFLVGVV